jgi:hypothetical protein
MASPQALLRCELALRGIDYPYGSFEEASAFVAFFREQNIRYLATLSIINAIISVGNTIASAVSGSTGSGGNSDTVQKTVAALRGLLIPEDEAYNDNKMDRIKKVLEQEVAKGPITVRAQASGKKGRAKLKKKE